MTRPLTPDPEQFRLAGVPVETRALREAVRLRLFNPEDPRFLVPRLLGAGWSINFGAVAVRLGLLRPDDTIADLAEHLPQDVARALRWGPWVPAAAGIIAALAGSRAGHLPYDWNARLEPKKVAPAWAALGIPASIGTLAAAWSSSNAADEPPDMLRSGLGAGIATGATCLIGCSLLGTRRARQPETLAIVLAPAAVTAATVTLGLRSARKNLSEKLRGESRSA